MLYLTKEQVIDFHGELIKHSGGEAGILDQNRLKSILETVKQTFGGELLLKTKEEIAGAYLFYFISGHSFIDGNKRVGVFAALEFLSLNQYPEGNLLSLPKDELIKIALEVAKGELNREETISRLKEILA